MKKKILSLLLASVFAFSLTACGSDSKLPIGEAADISTESSSSASTPAPTSEAAAASAEGSGEEGASAENTDISAPSMSRTLSIAWWGNQTRYELTEQALALYSEQNPNITFDAQSFEWNDYWTKLSRQVGDNSLPSCLQMDYSYLEQYVSDDLLVDLTPYVENGTLDMSSVDPGILESGSVNGKLYGICVSINAPALLYNKTLLDDLGIAISDNMTTKEFMDICKQVYEQTGIKTALSYATGDSYLPFLLRSQGINQPFNTDSLNIPSASALLPCFQIYETGIKEGWAIGSEVLANLTSNVAEQSPLVYFTSEETQSWCGFFWSNQLPSLADAAPDGMEIAITTWPSDNPQLSNYLKPSQFFVVTRDAGENEEEAVKVINYLLNSVEANSILRHDRGVPASSKVAAAISPLLDDIDKTTTAYINNVVTPNCSPINPPIPDGAIEVYDYYNQLIDRILIGQITAREAANALYTQGNKIMAK